MKNLALALKPNTAQRFAAWKANYGWAAEQLMKTVFSDLLEEVPIEVDLETEINQRLDILDASLQLVRDLGCDKFHALIESMNSRPGDVPLLCAPSMVHFLTWSVEKLGLEGTHQNLLSGGTKQLTA